MARKNDENQTQTQTPSVLADAVNQLNLLRAEHQKIQSQIADLDAQRAKLQEQADQYEQIFNPKAPRKARARTFSDQARKIFGAMTIGKVYAYKDIQALNDANVPYNPLVQLVDAKAIEKTGRGLYVRNLAELPSLEPEKASV